MLVSVIMPVYNGEQYLREAIDSVLNQSFKDYELIIINDCSTDATEDIILSYSDNRIVYLKNTQNLGVAVSLNNGLKVASGKYIARLDADDIALETRLEKQVEYMEKNPQIDVLGTSSVSFNDTGVLFEGHPTVDEEWLRIDFLFSCAICHPTVMMRASTLKEKQLCYDNSFNKIEDYELWCRMLDLKCRINNIDLILLEHRLHEGQVTNQFSADMLQKLRLLYRRNLNNIGVFITELEFDSFFWYCLRNRYNRTIDYSLLNNVLEKILSSNYYERKKFKKYCKGIVMNVLDQTCSSVCERIMFAKKSSFISILYLVLFKFKNSVL